MSRHILPWLLRHLRRICCRPYCDPGKNPAATPEAMHARANAGLPTHCYTQNTLLDIRRRASEAEDNELLRSLGRTVLKITAAADAHVGAERDAYIRAKLEELERSMQ